MLSKNQIFGISLLALLLASCGASDNSSLSVDDTVTPHPKFSRVLAKVSNAYAPTGNIKERQPTFKWQAVSGATEYSLGHEDANSATQWYEYIISATDANCSSGTTCSYKPADITFAVGDEKVWWVRGKVQGAWQDWSAPYVFTVIGDTNPLPASEPIYPIGNINTQNPNYKWTPGNGATQYEFGIESADSSQWESYIVSANNANCQATECSFTPASSILNNGDSYTWWVREFRNNDWENWSNGASFSVNTIVAPTDEAFKIKVDTTISNLTVSPINQFILSTKGSGYNYEIDCNNDGTPEAIGVSGNYTCTYQNPGIYTISIKGDFPQIYFFAPEAGNPIYNTDARKILEVVQWGNQQWRSMENAFAGAENMKITAIDNPDLSQVQNMFSMFWLAATMNHDLSDWDMSGVTNMSAMFGLARNFNQDISTWDVSNVTDMSYMFDEAESFNQDISVWDMSSVMNITEMFWGAKAFNQPIGNWNTSNIENMYNVFYTAEIFDQDLSNWDVRSVKPSVSQWPFNGMEGIFRGANLSTSNYDKLLLSWASQNVQSNIIFDATNVKYSASSAPARLRLISQYGWTIRDGGQL